MFSDLSERDQKDFNDTVELVNADLCKGIRVFFLQENGRENVISEILETYSANGWRCLYSKGMITFHQNLGKQLDNKPADYRSVK